MGGKFSLLFYRGEQIEGADNRVLGKELEYKRHEAMDGWIMVKGSVTSR